MTQDTNITLEDIAERHMNVGMFMNMDMSCLLSFLADPAILAHIPGVKALREENERLTRDRDAKSARMWELGHECDRLEAQLAALQAGGEVCESGPWRAGETLDGSRAFVQSDDFTHDVRLYVSGDFASNQQRLAYAEEIARRLNTQAPASVQPAAPISAIPPGYAVVLIKPNMATSGAMVQAYMSGFRRSLPLGQKLALAWAAGIKESEIKDA